MYILSIDKDKCVDCGNCEALLPGLVHKLKGKLMISERHYDREKQKIDQAITDCHLDCISLVHGVRV